jgi:hypothetical protein
MCDYPDTKKCTNPSLTAWSARSNVGGLCQEHYDRMVSDITDKGTFDFGTFTDDYVKVKLLLTREDFFLDQIAALEKWHQANPKEKGMFAFLRKYHRISATLRHFELLCNFPPNLVVPRGVLSNEDFHEDLVKYGYMWKDVGASLNHGLFAHRLQWHAILRRTTADFTTPLDAQHWDHSAYEIFTSMAAPQAVQRQSVWGHLLDNSATGEGFTRPNSVEPKIRKSGRAPSLMKLIDEKYLPLQQDFDAVILPHSAKWAQEEMQARVKQYQEDYKKAHDEDLQDYQASAKLKNEQGVTLSRLQLGRLDEVWDPYYFAQAGFPLTEKEVQTLQELNVYKPGKVKKDKTLSPANVYLGGKSKKLYFLKGEKELTEDEVKARAKHSRTDWSYDSNKDVLLKFVS